jgi:hypothetical protein
MKPANIARIVVFFHAVGANPNSAQHIRHYVRLRCMVKCILSSTVFCTIIQENFSYLGCCIVSERDSCVTIKMSIFEHS